MEHLVIFCAKKETPKSGVSLVHGGYSPNSYIEIPNMSKNIESIAYYPRAIFQTKVILTYEAIYDIGLLPIILGLSSKLTALSLQRKKKRPCLLPIILGLSSKLTKRILLPSKISKGLLPIILGLSS